MVLLYKLPVLTQQFEVRLRVHTGRADLRALPSVELKPGLMGTTCAPGHEIHSIFNRGKQTAYSLHVYSQEITTYRAFDLERHTFETQQCN